MIVRLESIQGGSAYLDLVHGTKSGGKETLEDVTETSQPKVPCYKCPREKEDSSRTSGSIQASIFLTSFFSFSGVRGPNSWCSARYLAASSNSWVLMVFPSVSAAQSELAGLMSCALMELPSAPWPEASLLPETAMVDGGSVSWDVGGKQPTDRRTTNEERELMRFVGGSQK
ncbi:hypothetical protein VTK73DRAFT_10247 [Phialemonium thermophilum]|uniref:Uncharacterized protein n=1 Tax=Phialemonium thermophilum TaxID=223376 RepID=A0ABR3VXR1_9PEZI